MEAAVLASGWSLNVANLARELVVSRAQFVSIRKSRIPELDAVFLFRAAYQSRSRQVTSA